MDNIKRDELRDIEKLKDTSNFQFWKFQVTIVLKAGNAYEIMTGQSVKPTADGEDGKKDQKQLKEWQKGDALAQKVIVQTVERSVMIHLMNCDSAKAMWDVLLKLYERDDTEQRCQLLEEFFNAKYQKGTSIMSHVSTLENLYTRLNAIKGNVSEQMLITKIITTLPSHYSYFSAAWEATATETLC
nr:PREDICTED: uncharacterized protein LOC109032049 [Bemisia tabaci]